MFANSQRSKRGNQHRQRRHGREARTNRAHLHDRKLRRSTRLRRDMPSGGVERAKHKSRRKKMRADRMARKGRVRTS